MFGECQDIISTIKAMPTFPKFTKTQFDALKDTIDCPAFDNLELVDTITEDEGQYTRVEFYPQNHEEGLDPALRDAANDFASKCMFQRLYKYDNYNNNEDDEPNDENEDDDGMKTKWYSALFEWWNEGNMNAKKDAIEDFLHFTNVTTIGAGAFQANVSHTTAFVEGANQDDDGLTVTIPKSVTTIRQFAFNDRGITSVTIPESVKTIEHCAFSFNRLTQVTIPNSVTEIGQEAFMGNQLRSVEIPNGIEIIRPRTFIYNQLESVNIPNSVRAIEFEAFRDNQLKSVNIPNGVEIGFSAFHNNQLKSVNIPNGVRAIGFSAFDNNQLKSVIIPDSVRTIESYAFHGENHELEEVEVSERTTVEDHAFNKDVTIRRRK